MLYRLIALCIQRRLAVIAVTLMVAVFGVYAYLRTPVEAYPDVTNVQVEVVAQVSGLAPEEMERQVTIPLERALNGNPGMIQMRSESGFGLTIIWCVFEDGMDSFRARTQTAERLLTAEVPEEAFVRLTPDATPLGKIYYYRLVSDRHDLYQLRSEQEWTVARLLKQVPGVADAVGMGGFLKEMHIEVDPTKLASYGLTLKDVTDAVEHSNLNVGGGFQRRGDQQFMIRGIGYLMSPQDIKDIVLEVDDGTPVTIRDVARVVQSYTPRQGAVGYNEEREIVEGIVLLRRGENPEEVLDGIHEKVDYLNQHILPEGMRIEPMYDRSTLTGLTLHTVHENMLHGFLLIVGVVWLFLRTVRGSLLVAVVIPLSLLTAFAGLYLIDLPANLISMGAIDFGILVDGAVVLVESAVHEGRAVRPTNKREMLELVGRSTLRVARPTFFAMAVIIAALIPVFTLQSVEGRIFRPLALTYSFALIGALVFSLTVVPALCAVFMRPKDAATNEPKSLLKLRDGYGALVGWLLAGRKFVGLAVGVILLVLGLLVAPRVGTEFLPELDEGDVFVVVEMPPSISLERGQDVLAEVRRRLMAFPEVLSTPAEQGRPEDGLDNETTNMSETFARLKPRDQWRPGYDSARLVAEMRDSLSEIPGVKFNFSQPIKDRVEEAVSGVRGKIVLKAFGTDLVSMRQTLLNAKEVLADVEGVVDLGLYRDATVPQLQIKLNRAVLARAGVSVVADAGPAAKASGGSSLFDVGADEETPEPDTASADSSVAEEAKAAEPASSGGSLFDLGSDSSQAAPEEEQQQARTEAVGTANADDLSSSGSLFDVSGEGPHDPTPLSDSPDESTDESATETGSASTAQASPEAEVPASGSLFDISAPEEPEPSSEPEAGAEAGAEDGQGAPRTGDATAEAGQPSSSGAEGSADTLAESGSLFDIAAPQAAPEPSRPDVAEAEPARNDDDPEAASVEAPGRPDPAAVSAAATAAASDESTSGDREEPLVEEPASDAEPVSDEESISDEESDSGTGSDQEESTDERREKPAASTGGSSEPRTDVDIDGEGSLFDL